MSNFADFNEAFEPTRLEENVEEKGSMGGVFQRQQNIVFVCWLNGVSIQLLGEIAHPFHKYLMWMFGTICVLRV